jgi:putative addiction module component (TIGR02574 family)
MIQQQVLEQIIRLPIPERIEIIEKMWQSVRKDLIKSESKANNFEERSTAIKQLSGIAKTDNPPMTKEDDRKIIEDYLALKN